ncbi:glycosyltransferase [Candidatus Saccharibacteria bacterium]|nr:glycosyltransferase [Candidatus Saccharibacteria bacterium]
MPKKNPKLSILVPVYNVEEFLPLCLESIKNQSFKDFECILINDGSTDNSLKLLKKIAKADKRFIIIDKKNTGYGASMNEGLKLAKGEYIGIVEPDDFIHRDFYSTLFEHSEDIIKTSFMHFSGKTWELSPERVFHEVRKDFPVNGAVIRPKENHRIFLVDPTIWSAVYKREMLEKNKVKLLETPGASYQDAGFQFKAFSVAASIFCIEKPLYYYRIDNEKSSVKSNKKIKMVKTEFDEIDRFIKSEFQEIADACRFRSYNWNLNRLKLKEALEFAKIAKADYKQKSFNPKYFIHEKHSRRHELKFSTKHPVCYVFLRPIFKLKNTLKRIARKIIKK